MSPSSRFSCHRSPHKPVLNLKLLRPEDFCFGGKKNCITGDWCRVRITLFQIHSLWLSFGSRPTWEIIRHLLQPRWCHCRCGPLVRAQTESQARWVKAVSQMPDNHSRSSARDLTTLLRFSKSSWNMRLAFFSANTLVLPSSRSLLIAIRTILSWTSSSLGLLLWR